MSRLNHALFVRESYSGAKLRNISHMTKFESTPSPFMSVIGQHTMNFV